MQLLSISLCAEIHHSVYCKVRKLPDIASFCIGLHVLIRVKSLNKWIKKVQYMDASADPDDLMDVVKVS